MPVAFNAVTTAQSSFTTALTFSHTPAGSDRCLYVGIVASNEDVSTVTFNGTGMTAVESGSARIRLYRLVAPTATTADVVVTHVGPTACIAIAASYTGVDQTTPDDGVQSSATGDGSPSVTVTSATDNLVVGMSGSLDGSGQSVQTVGAGQTSRGSYTQDSGYLILSDEAGAASVTHSYTRNGGFYYAQRIVAVSVNDAGGGGGSITFDEDYQLIVPVQASW